MGENEQGEWISINGGNEYRINGMLQGWVYPNASHTAWFAIYWNGHTYAGPNGPTECVTARNKVEDNPIKLERA